MSMSTQQRCRLSFEMWNLQSTWWVGSFLNFRSKILVPETKNRDFFVTKIWTDCCHLEEVCNFNVFYLLYSNLYKILKIFFVCIHIHMQKNAMHCTYNVIISCHPIGRANMGWNDEQCCARLVHHWAGQGDGGDPRAHLQGARYHQLSFWEGAPVPKVPWGARTEEVCS